MKELVQVQDHRFGPQLQKEKKERQKKKKEGREVDRRQIAMNTCPQLSPLYIAQDPSPENARNGTNHSGLVLRSLLP